MKVDADFDISTYNECTNEDIYEINDKEKNYDNAEKIDLNNSPDCVKLNRFLLKNDNINCCQVQGITCDIDNNITDIN
eukprot:jgi/Orpsp1_1/1184806/evm.model.c7180000091028.1